LFLRLLKKGNTANAKAGLILLAASAQHERGFSINAIVY